MTSRFAPVELARNPGVAPRVDTAAAGIDAEATPCPNRWVLPGLTGGAVGLSLLAPVVARRVGWLLPKALADRAAIIGCVVVGWGAVALGEHAYPLELADDQGGETLRTDLLYLFGSGPVISVAALGIAHVAETTLSRRFGWGGSSRFWPRRAPLAARAALALGVTELVHYWQHRLAHEHEVLWRSHAVHHSSTRLYWLNATRFHPADLASLMWAQVLSALVLGVDPDAATAYLVFKGIHGQIQHSNIDGSSGPLGLVFSTAEQHRWHHAETAGGRTVNYGAATSLWDRLFGTYHPGSASDRPAVAGVPDFPRTWWQQIIRGFQRSAPARSTLAVAGGDRSEASLPT